MKKPSLSDLWFSLLGMFMLFLVGSTGMFQTVHILNSNSPIVKNPIFGISMLLAFFSTFFSLMWGVIQSVIFAIRQERYEQWKEKEDAKSKIQG